jgi:hypothetical protein
MRLDQLDCEARLADATTTDHHQLVFSRELQHRRARSASKSNRQGVVAHERDKTSAASSHSGGQQGWEETGATYLGGHCCGWNCERGERKGTIGASIGRSEPQLCCGFRRTKGGELSGWRNMGSLGNQAQEYTGRWCWPIGWEGRSGGDCGGGRKAVCRSAGATDRSERGRTPPLEMCGDRQSNFSGTAPGGWSFVACHLLFGCSADWLAGNYRTSHKRWVVPASQWVRVAGLKKGKAALEETEIVLWMRVGWESCSGAGQGRSSSKARAPEGSRQRPGRKGSVCLLGATVG